MRQQRGPGEPVVRVRGVICPVHSTRPCVTSHQFGSYFGVSPNSNGDVPMLDFAQHDDKPSLRLLLLHDDAEREYDYVAGAEQALERGAKGDWTVVSIKNDWNKVF